MELKPQVAIPKKGRVRVTPKVFCLTFVKHDTIQEIAQALSMSVRQVELQAAAYRALGIRLPYRPRSKASPLLPILMHLYRTPILPN